MHTDLEQRIRAATPEPVHKPPFEQVLVDARSHRRTRRVGGLLTAGAATAAVVVALFAFASGRPAQDVSVIDPAAPPNATAAATPATDVTCGSELPVMVPVPGRYQGPTLGPNPHGTDPVEHGQHAVHWTSATGTIEVRWPADADASVWSTRNTRYVGDVTQQDDGTWKQTMELPATGVTQAGCTHMQVTVYDQTRTGLDATAESLFSGPYLPVGTPLVAESRPADALPSAIACNAPAGVATPPNQGGETELSPAASPEEALAAFLEEHRTLLFTEYTALNLPDGSIAYVQPSPERDGAYITVIHVIETPLGWRVESSDASGC